MRVWSVILLLVLAVLLPATVPALSVLPPEQPGPGSFNFQLVGHDPLDNRGMNAAPAFYDAPDGHSYMYVGSRTDGRPDHPHPGILVVDVTNPAAPHVVGEIGAPNEALVGMTSRELRVWPQQGLLIVMNFACSSEIHGCTGGDTVGVNGVNFEPANFRFFDVRADPVNPPLVDKWVSVDAAGVRRTPHEMFLWVDPANDTTRALMYITTPGAGAAVGLVIADISHVRDGVVTVAGDWGAQRDSGLTEDPFTPLIWAPDVQFPQPVWDEIGGDRAILHSMSVTPDGKVGHLAYYGAGYFAIDTSDFANNVPSPHVRLLTPIANRVDYSPSLPPETHSAVKVPGKDVVMLTDEVYPFIPGLIPDGGCPWGWVHFVDIRDIAHPQLVGEYKTAFNDPSFCDGLGQAPLVSFTSHNPTLLPHVALVTWHSAGLQAFAPDPSDPQQLGVFNPQPLPVVATEDPALNGPLGLITMWSYPIIHHGLIYVVDLRNGLYVLKYTGPHAGEVSDVSFLEGNSNLGDALRLDSDS
jgi:hypothetical protein